MYITIGNNAFKSEFIYSLLSLDHIIDVSFKENTTIIVYTDALIPIPVLQSGIPVIQKVADKKKIKYWIKKSNGNVLILKARLLQEFLNEFNTKVIFVDTDTFFIRDIASLFERIQKHDFVLHIREEKLINRIMLYQFLSSKGAIIDELRDQFIPEKEQYMWNSGVVGLDSCHAPVISRVCELIEQLSSLEHYPVSELHTREQLSFSLVFQNYGKIIPAEQYIVHYWFLKPFRFVLAKHFMHFCYNDQSEISLIIQSLGVEENGIIPNNFNGDLTALLIDLLNRYLPNQKYHLDVIPAGTFLGDLMRQKLTN